MDAPCIDAWARGGEREKSADARRLATTCRGGGAGGRWREVSASGAAQDLARAFSLFVSLVHCLLGCWGAVCSLWPGHPLSSAPLPLRHPHTRSLGFPQFQRYLRATSSFHVGATVRRIPMPSLAAGLIFVFGAQTAAAVWIREPVSNARPLVRADRKDSMILALRGGQQPAVHSNADYVPPEVANNESPVWSQLGSVLEEFKGNSASAKACEEAARKLIGNHMKVVEDITNRYPRTQRNLGRLPREAQADVDNALAEVARRLLSEPELSASALTPSAPASAQAAEVWVAAVEYLSLRLQTEAIDVPSTAYGQPRKSRAADMSPAAGGALQAALAEVAAVARGAF